MKFVLLICMFFSGLFFANEDADRTVSELTVSELKEIVRMIVEESIEQCKEELN